MNGGSQVEIDLLPRAAVGRHGGGHEATGEDRRDPGTLSQVEYGLEARAYGRNMEEGELVPSLPSLFVSLANDYRKFTL